MTPLWPTPPQGPKNDVGEALPGHSRPLLRLAKVTQKRGFSWRFPSSFPTVLPVVSRRFCQQFSGGFANGFPTVFPAVRQRRGPPGSTPIRLRRTPSSERNCRAILYTLSSLQTQHSALSFDRRKNPAEYELKEKQDARERRLAADDIAQNLYQPIPGGDYVEHPAATGLHHRGDICLLRPLAAPLICPTKLDYNSP